MKKKNFRMWLISYFMLVWLFQLTVAQEDNKIMIKKNNAITVSPLAVFNILNPSLQMGYQRNLTPNLLFQIDAGIILRHSVFGFLGCHLYNGSVNYSYSGYKFQVGLRRVLSKSYFIDGEMTYLKNKGNVNNTYVDSYGNSYDDFFIQERYRYGINSKFGMKYVVSHRLLLEWSVGLGISYHNVNHYDRENMNNKAYSSLYGYLLKHGNYFRLNLPINGKVGYIF